MENLTRYELQQIIADAVADAIGRITSKHNAPSKGNETMNFEEALDYLRSRNCVNTKSTLYKIDGKIIPYKIIGRRRVYYLADLRRYADRKLGLKTA